ncbi:MAG: YggS family pyridoxal phosphate-dependent enzyme [Candidatus Omnitrophica bacterium]|nr:YggS family pyridoxal phosphate-dependent enzyme [Candidatus Omnitrophota bacterium]
MIADNIRGVKERIAKICAKAGRDPAQITIVAISKNRSADEVEEAIGAGITDVGENKLQEARLKADSRNLRAVRWHMVGHLQSNKVKDALNLFDLIHSVDSEELAQEIDKQAAKINKVQDILIQVNTSGEESKFGLRPAALNETFLVIKALKNVRIVGLMTIAPLVDDPEKVRLYFRRLKELRDKVINLRLTTYDLRLSMGMSDDFEVAIEEGADIVRIGRAIYD